MQIIAHRGYWLNETEKNTQTAFERAFENGFGIETDIRDHMGKLVVSHAFPMGNEMPLEELLNTHQQYAKDLPLALHLHSCGLGNSLQEILKKYKDSNIFCFGNPLPDLRFCVQNLDIPIWTTYADLCPFAPFMEQVTGVWIDDFNGTSDFSFAKKVLNSNKKACLVSADIYQRKNKPFLENLKSQNLLTHKNLMICSNNPLEISLF